VKSSAYYNILIRYFLLDTQTFANEKDISIYEILPQAESCPDAMKPEILALGVPIDGFEGKLLLDRFELFEKWKEKYAYKGQYYYQSTLCNNENCRRECIDINNSNIVLDSFQLNYAIDFEFQDNKYMDEVFTYSFCFWKKTDDTFLKHITIPSLPHEFFEAREISIKLTENKKCKPPTIDFTKVQLLKGRTIVVNALVDEFVSPDIDYYFREDHLIYSDLVQNWRIGLTSNFGEVIYSKSTFSYLEQIDIYDSCYKPLKLKTSQTATFFNY
jgi:hypothetical protein